jgi:hypothetical protein
MSLTEILSYPDVAAEFNKYLRVPILEPQVMPKMVAPPRYHDSYALVGTAFDYCLRFCIAACNQGLAAEQTWVAEIAIKLMEHEEEKLPPGLSLEQARKGVRRARELYQGFLKTKVFTRQFVRAALFLAALDKAYRTGSETIVLRYLSEPLQYEVEDCMRLLRVIPREMITAKQRAALNPTFGEASTLVNGADADFVIDETLVDIKTTKYYQITSTQLHQLIGYRMLLAACEQGGSTALGQPIITHGAIYFSRHAKLERFHYADLIDRWDFLTLSRWFISYVSDDPLEVETLMQRIESAELF